LSFPGRDFLPGNDLIFCSGVLTSTTLGAGAPRVGSIGRRGAGGSVARGGGAFGGGVFGSGVFGRGGAEPAGFGAGLVGGDFERSFFGTGTPEKIDEISL
jgi:hypothetical protein